MATGTFQITHVARVLFLWGSAGLDCAERHPSGH